MLGVVGSAEQALERLFARFFAELEGGVVHGHEVACAGLAVHLPRLLG